MLVFSDGRTRRCYGGIVGLNPDLHPTYGSDGEFYLRGEGAFETSGDEGEPFTPEQRAELADYMIGLWQAFKRQSA